MLIRLARMSDLRCLVRLSRSIEGGMTSMPTREEAWYDKLVLAERSQQSDYQGDERLYLLVLEEPQHGQIVGTAAIYTGVGLSRPFYNYKLAKHVKASASLGITVTSNSLNLVNDYTGQTELASLYLDPAYRINRLGQALSRSRFMLMQAFPERFNRLVFAEIRGFLNEQGESPFWEAVGRKFFNLSYAEADHLSAVEGSQFISDLMPHHPVYLELLPEQAAAVVGKPHTASAAAMKLLEYEGMSYQGAVDIFDAGPVIEAPIEHLRSLKQCRAMRFKGLQEAAHQGPANYLISNNQANNYRILPLHLADLDDISEDLRLTPEQADRLAVQPGDLLQLLPLRS